jgi:dTDP-4-dehydrorhamnose reductase
VLDIIETNKWESGIYHYSNEGKISWYEFAIAIKELIGSKCKVNFILTAAYPTAAKRPHYSLLNKEKIKTVYHSSIPQWKASLKKCISLLTE